MTSGGFPAGPAETAVAKTSSVVSVGGTTTALVGNNPGRNCLILQCDHATQVAYVTLATTTSSPSGGSKPVAPTAVLNSGIRLNAAGVGPIFLWGYTGPAAAIATGASTPVLVTEI